MISSGWTEAVIIDGRATQAQKTAVENILTGRAGGPWEVLDRFVERRLPTRTAPIEITDEDTVKRVVIEGLMESTIENIRGWDRNQPVTFMTMFNQVHDSTQVIARGDTAYDDEIILKSEGTNALHSPFDWSVIQY